MTLQGNFGLIFHFFLTAILYFHFYNICGFTSQAKCLSTEIVDFLTKHNKEARQDLSNFNITNFFETEADIYVLRIVSDTPDRILEKRNKGGYNSGRNQKTVFLSPAGDVSSYKGSSNYEMQEHEQRRMLREHSKNFIENQKDGKFMRQGPPHYRGRSNKTLDYQEAAHYFPFYTSYPHDSEVKGHKFHSVILNEEMEGFD